MQIQQFSSSSFPAASGPGHTLKIASGQMRRNPNPAGRPVAECTQPGKHKEKVAAAAATRKVPRETRGPAEASPPAPARPLVADAGSAPDEVVVGLDDPGRRLVVDRIDDGQVDLGPLGRATQRDRVVRVVRARLEIPVRAVVVDEELEDLKSRSSDNPPPEAAPATSGARA